MLVVIEKVLVIFLMILVGFVANKARVLPDSASGPLSNLMLYVTAPCMAMCSIYDKELSPEIISSTVQVLAGSAVYFAAATLIGIAVVRIFKFSPKEDFGIYVAATACVNSGFMGFPVTMAIFGSDIFYLMVMQNIILNIYMYGAVPPVLELGHREKPDVKATLKSMCNISMLAVIAGIVMLLTGVQPPAMLDEVIVTLSDVTVPLSMIIVGIRLGSADIGKMFSDRQMVITNFVSMLVIPLLVFAVTAPLDFLHDDAKITLVFAATFPSAMVPVALAEQKKKNSQLMAEIVSLTTFTSLITIPLMAMLLMWWYY